MDTVKKFRCCLYSLLKKFRALNFRGLGQQRNFFNNENFPIYGICYISTKYVCSHHNIKYYISIICVYIGIIILCVILLWCYISISMYIYRHHMYRLYGLIITHSLLC